LAIAVFYFFKVFTDPTKSWFVRFLNARSTVVVPRSTA
jgi:hypothetical protein